MKRSLEFKLEVVNYVLKECNSKMGASKKYGVSLTSIRDWISLYKQHGADGLFPKKERYYDGQFKIDVLKYMQEHGLSLSETAALFCVPSRVTIMKWKRMLYSEKYMDIILKENRSVKQMTKKKKAEYENLTESEKRIKELEARILELEMENDIIKKKCQLFQEKEITQGTKTEIINELRSKYRFNNLLKALDIPRSSYYYHLEQLSKVDKYADIKCAIYYIYDKNNGCYGYRRIKIELKRIGIHLNEKTVRRLMSELGLKSMVRMKKYSSYKGGVGKESPNLLNRDFVASKPNEKWSTDLTEFKLFGEKVYLSPIFDLYNGEIISYNISRRPVLEQVKDMLEKAFAKIGNDTNLILHSDQGWQYRHDAYHKLLKDKGIRQSMSRKGNCLDNGAMESFFGHLKSELLYIGNKFDSIEHFIKKLEDYIYYYNNERIKTKLEMSPVEYRELYYKSVA